MDDDLVFSQLQQELPTSQIDDAPSTLAIAPTQEDFARSSKFSVSYYRQFFNVDTSDVIYRLMIAINPLDTRFFEAVTQPDLYGPIWVTITVSFISMLFGNLSVWTQLGSKWHYSFSRFIAANVFAFIFVLGMPFIWKYLTKNLNAPSLISVISMFGYSLSMNIFTSILCLLVGRNADFLFSLVSASLCGFSFFRKLSAAFTESSDKTKVFIPNIIASIAFGLIMVIIQRIVH